MFSPYFSSGNSSFKFILDILDGMDDWVRVVDRSNSVIFINRSMERDLGIRDLAGKKCYEIMGCGDPCDNCITDKAVFEGKSCKKIEVFNNRIFSVMSSPIIADDGNVYYAVEVLRDITKEKEMERELIRQNQKLQHDLEMARKLQMQLLPRKNVKIPGLDFAYLYQPCDDLSGDMVNIFQVDRDRVGIYIADVSGHGVSASMLTIFIISTLNKKTRSPSRALYRLFRQYNLGDFDKDSYITIFYGIYNTRTRVLTYSNAGHNCAPVIIGRNGVKKLYMPAIPISNWVDDPKYYDATIQLDTGDRLFLYTDGVADQWLEEPGKITSDGFIMETLSEKNSDLQAILNKIYDYVHTRLENIGVRQKDDITMALMQPVQSKGC
ncbi:phosphatase [Thermoclostridium stercorarium subsp. thermolacticum DSM 2910]|jgi:sigma-B regulation protein RsbU (phosphoserine phosphatase)|uniref:Phosphatase n=3 Tax=Thermoclostridium stercorarium TaxID=1510 RepID=A0A1B1YNT4_THEST|nr:SpoIIE family protein phosphatase [Thermoclostridium stercorarium]ANW99779.1 phosphatase [Thermoclostridium stercorarium subsp. thermolacticum DSM 2910]ANX02406.1 phosphatase [Thermoclostridium stercorarium subsp. leptospartum DSM 9219]UZQ85487.1 SpoIIE family protein phosphatase [Thermoclostridium stercorarium]